MTMGHNNYISLLDKQDNNYYYITLGFGYLNPEVCFYIKLGNNQKIIFNMSRPIQFVSQR